MSCLYYHCAEDGKILYIGKSVNLHSRTTSHAHGAPWWDEVAFIYVEHIPKEVDLDQAEQFRIASMEPVHNKLRYGKADRKLGKSETPESRAKKIGFNDDSYTTLEAMKQGIDTAIGLTAPVDWQRIFLQDPNYRQTLLFELMTMQIHAHHRQLREIKRAVEREDFHDYQSWERWLAAQGKIMLLMSRLIQDIESTDKTDSELMAWCRNQLFDSLAAMKSILCDTNSRLETKHCKTPSQAGDWIWRKAFGLVYNHLSDDSHPAYSEEMELLDANNRSRGFRDLT